MKTENLITLKLTQQQAKALAWMLAYGIDEKEYALKQARDYSEEETLEQETSLALAKQALYVAQSEIYGKAEFIELK